MKLAIASFALFALHAHAAGPFYIGCYNDCATDCSQRDLPHFFCSNGNSDGGCDTDPVITSPNNWAGYSTMTPQYCSGMCTGFKFFGLQFGGNCFCGNDYGNQGGKIDE